jgi:hypothetical protein
MLSAVHHHIGGLENGFSIKYNFVNCSPPHRWLRNEVEVKPQMGRSSVPAPPRPLAF